MKILVTGASGFIGNFLLAALRDAGREVGAASRSRVEQRGIGYVSAPELGPDADWSRALNGVDVVIHLAGRAHVPSKNAVRGWSWRSGRAQRSARDPVDTARPDKVSQIVRPAH